jgi:hypothetical protein
MAYTVSPQEVVKLEHEVAVDLHEIYDIDITPSPRSAPSSSASASA